jgi:hypothetical protein
LGLCFRTAGFDEVDVAQMTREIGIYKDFRFALRNAAATLLTPQAAAGQGPAWDVVQTIPSGNRDTVVAAFQSTGRRLPITIKPVGLRAFTRYEVHSVDVGSLEARRGRIDVRGLFRSCRHPSAPPISSYSGRHDAE